MTPRPVERDTIAEAHIIARSAPGLGNPLDLSCAEFELHLKCALEGHSSQPDAASWMRRYVERR